MYKNITRLLRKVFLSCCLDLIQNLYIYNKIRTIWGDILDGKKYIKVYLLRVSILSFMKTKNS